MKFSIEIEIEEEQEEMKPPSAFERRVAKMLAKKAGRKTPNEMDMKKAAEMADEEEDNGD
jgi:hypothetical protein